MDELTIGEVARRSGLRPSALRFYEQRGLLAPSERVNGQRRYALSVLAQLRLLHFVQRAGFTLAEAHALLAPGDETVPPKLHWEQLAQHKLHALEEQIARLHAMRELVEEGLACPCADLRSCERIGVPISEGATMEEHGAPFDPDAHHWRHRLVLIFGASPADPDMAAQHEALAAQAAALDERDLVVATLFDGAVGESSGQPVTPEQTAALRTRYGVAPGAFAVLLLGKDGGVKLRAQRPITVDTIAGLIDTMPMRQAEMREREPSSK